MHKKMVLTLFAALISTSVVAEEDRGFTFGLGIAQNKYSLNPENLDGAEGKDDTFGWMALGGYRFNKYLAIEAAYLDGGSISDSADGLTLEMDGKAYGGSLMGTIPVGELTGIYGRLGMLHGEIDVSISDGVDTLRGETSDDEVWYGIGIWRSFETAQIRLEYSRSEFELLDIDHISLSVAWLF